LSEQAELMPEAEQAPTAPGPDDLTFRLGPNVLRLVPYSRDCWRSLEPAGALNVRKVGRSWIAGLGVGLEFLGPYVDRCSTLLARGRGSSLQEAEAALNAELEGLRRLIGGPTT
jgi:hypothetical protein